MFNIKVATDLAGALLTGEGGLFAQIIEKKLESIGQQMILSYLAGPSGTAQRVSRAIATGGQSEFDRTRDEFLRGIMPRSTSRYASKIRKFDAVLRAASRSGKDIKRNRHARPGSWQASSWAASRQDWLDNRWRHDWRSQPRDEHGRWVPGRLEYIAASMQYRGKKTGRVILRRRKKRRLRRVATRRELRKIMKGIRDGS